MVIRQTLLQSIYLALDSASKLSADDFSVETEARYAVDGSRYVDIDITFRYDKEYHFSASLPDKTDHTISLKYVPGEISLSEKSSAKDKDALTLTVRQWAKRVYEELSAAPFVRDMKNYDQRISDIENIVQNVSDVELSADERVELYRRLDDLELKFSEHLQETIEEQYQLKQELEQIKTDIEALKLQMNMFDRRNWIKSFMIKMSRWAKRNPSAVRALGSITQELLPPNIRDSIPNDAIGGLFIGAATLVSDDKAHEEQVT